MSNSRPSIPHPQMQREAALPAPIELEAEVSAVNLRDPGETIVRILRAVARLGGSDVHLRVHAQPLVRLDGELRALNHPPLTESTIASAALALAASAGVSPEKVREPQADFSCHVADAGRFRVHVYRQAGTPALVLRRVPDPIPDFAALRLPPVVKRIALAERGLVLVVGATGNGKSTTIASMLEFINQNASKHIVTCEDPVEFVFKDQRSSFSQREVGRDVTSFEQALEGALREDPDVLFIGEIRTLEALDVALNAAESGRLVISTSHSQDAQRTIARLINFYPVDYRDAARCRLADALLAIIAQRLVPRKNARGRVLCTEILTGSPTVKDCIRDPARMRGITAALEAGTHEYGTHTFDQMLLAMARDNLITPETAQAMATSPSDLVRNLRLTR